MGQRCGAVEIMGVKKMLRQIKGQFEKYTFGAAVKNILYHFITRERRKSFGGKNPNETIYIIRSINDKSPFYIGPVHNLLANYFYVLSHIQYAKTKGWIPVVDQLHYPVYNSQKEPINGTTNAWEYFWQQPGGISLEEAYQSKNVVLSKQSWFWQWDMGYNPHGYQDEQCLAFYRNLSHSTTLNAQTQVYVDLVRRRVLPAKKKILGVNVRLGAHALQSERHGAGHPIQPEIDDLISKAKKWFAAWEMDFVLVTSDAQVVVDRFREAFGEKLLVFCRLRAEVGKEYGLDKNKEMYQKANLYQTSLDYLAEMELLASCDGLIGAVTSGMRYALVRSTIKSDMVRVIDCGLFQDPRKGERNS